MHLDDADNMLPIENTGERQALESEGLRMPCELICIGCSAQGVRSVVDQDGWCPRCNRHLLTGLKRDAYVPTLSPLDHAQPQPHPGTGTASRPGILRRFWRWLW